MLYFIFAYYDKIFFPVTVGCKIELRKICFSQMIIYFFFKHQKIIHKFHDFSVFFKAWHIWEKLNVGP